MMKVTGGHAETALAIANFSALLWEDIEKNDGAGAADFFEENGVFDSKMVCFNGRQEIRNWFSWRRDIVRTARHLITNTHYDFSAWEVSGEIELRGVMLHFGENGRPVLPLGPPIGIYDHRMIVVCGGLYGWSIRLLENDPVFMAPDHIALRYEASDRSAAD